MSWLSPSSEPVQNGEIDDMQGLWLINFWGKVTGSTKSREMLSWNVLWGRT